MQINSSLRVIACMLLLISVSGCVGMAIGAATDVVVEVAKVPFKVGGAVVDVVTGDEDKDKDKDKKNEKEAE